MEKNDILDIYHKGAAVGIATPFSELPLGRYFYDGGQEYKKVSDDTAFGNHSRRFNPSYLVVITLVTPLFNFHDVDKVYLAMCDHFGVFFHRQNTRADVARALMNLPVLVVTEVVAWAKMKWAQKMFEVETQRGIGNPEKLAELQQTWSALYNAIAAKHYPAGRFYWVECRGDIRRIDPSRYRSR